MPGGRCRLTDQVARVICDCDNTMGVPGKPIDDGQALLYLFGRQDVELLGITTCFGNGTVDEAFGATQALLCELGREDVPLFKGAGQRGQTATPAARFLAESVAAAPGEVTLLAIGPLSNLWAAARLDPIFFHKVKHISIMGGYLQALAGPYWENVPERNLASDSQASHAVLNAPCPVTLMTAQICLDAPFGLDELARLESWSGTRLHRAMRDWVLQCQMTSGRAGDYLWDLLPAVYISYPEMFEHELVQVLSTVADLASGRLVLRPAGAGPAVNVPSHIRDVEAFYGILYDAWSRVHLGECVE